MKKKKKYIKPLTTDVITFIEQYCLFNGEHIKLNNLQKKFIKWIYQLKLEKDIRTTERNFHFFWTNY